VHVQALVAEAPVEGLDKGILGGFAWSNEIELHTACEGPVLERARHEFGAVIDGDGHGHRPINQGAIERGANRLA
jgi:hypothetical protein